jgi:hypothetical protein
VDGLAAHHRVGGVETHYPDIVLDMYFADTGRFPHETIDGETVLIDSVKGRLFLLSGIGSWLWQRFIPGGIIDGVVAESIVRYGEATEVPIRQFLQELVEEQMLRPGFPPSAPPAEIPADWPDAFEPPVIERYDDIADIMSMDPIHEVDPVKGWPHKPDGTA